MTPLDYFILIPIAAGLVIGLFKGFISEVTSLLAIVLGILGARWITPVLAPTLANTLKISESWAVFLSYILLFVAIAILMHLLARMLGNVLKAASLGGINILLGGLFGGLKMALIVSVILNLTSLLEPHVYLIKLDSQQKSWSYSPVKKMLPFMWTSMTSKQTTDTQHENESGQ
jgi:membrane protein required for colicin V production